MPAERQAASSIKSIIISANDDGMMAEVAYSNDSNISNKVDSINVSIKITN